MRRGEGRGGPRGGAPDGMVYGIGRGEVGGGLADLVRVTFSDAKLLAAPAALPAIDRWGAGDKVVDGDRTVAEPLVSRPGAPLLAVGGAVATAGRCAVSAAVSLGSTDRAHLGPASRSNRVDTVVAAGGAAPAAFCARVPMVVVARPPSR